MLIQKVKVKSQKLKLKVKKLLNFDLHFLLLSSDF
jgi:hypothetical protein